MKQRIIQLTTASIATACMLASGPGDEGPKKNKLQTPVRLAVNSSSQLVVTDNRSRKVLTYDVTDSLGLSEVSSFEIEGRPSGIACFGGLIYVGNTTTHQVEIYNKKGKAKGILGDGQVYIGDPTDIAIDEAMSRLFVVDGLEHNVKVFDLSDPTGLWISTIAGEGLAVEQFQHPTGIALDTALQEVYVADYGEIELNLYPRVNVYGYDGSFKRWISGKTGGWFGGYAFSKPQGLAVDADNHVFIVDGWQGKVVAMDTQTGEKLKTFGTYGIEDDQLKLPLDIVIMGEAKNAWVTDSFNHRVEVFIEGGQIQ